MKFSADGEGDVREDKQGCLGITVGDGEPWGFMELMEARIEAGDSGLRAELLAKPNVGAGVLAGMHSPRTPAPASWCVGQGKGGLVLEYQEPWRSVWLLWSEGDRGRRWEDVRGPVEVMI